MNNRELIDILDEKKELSFSQWCELFSGYSPEDAIYARKKARAITDSIFGRRVFFRGIIELTNICRNDCLYCGIRASDKEVQRYRLTDEQIMQCCKNGYALGYRTFVLQGGEDPFYTDDVLTAQIQEIKSAFPDCAVTLSLGERSHESYLALYRAGADRYLLRHETAVREHYEKLHPSSMSFAHRMNCLSDLKAIGFQTGAGMMIGSPFQTVSYLSADMMYLKAFGPAMIGTGPFIPHHATPFASFSAGSTELTLFVISLLRIMLPDVLLPSTTALGTLSDDGRVRGLEAGCNVIMPNLSPKENQKEYMLYDGKSTGFNADDSLNTLKSAVGKAGYELIISRGDHVK
jgi:biotin synthase